MASYRLLCIALSAIPTVSLLSSEVHAGPQWAYNMASHECSLLRSGKPKSETTKLTYQRYPEYKKYIDEYGVGAWVTEMFNQCPEYASTSSGESASARKPNSACSLSSSQIYDISRGVKVTVKGPGCHASFN